MDTELAVGLLSRSRYGRRTLTPTEVQQVGDGVLAAQAAGFVVAVFERSKVAPTAKAKGKWKPDKLLPPQWAKEGFGFLPTSLPPSVNFEAMVKYLNEELVDPKGGVLRWFSEPSPVVLLSMPMAMDTSNSTPPPRQGDAPTVAMGGGPLSMAMDLSTPPPARSGDPTVVASSGSAGKALPPLRLREQTEQTR